MGSFSLLSNRPFYIKDDSGEEYLIIGAGSDKDDEPLDEKHYWGAYKRWEAGETPCEIR